MWTIVNASMTEVRLWEVVAMRVQMDIVPESHAARLVVWTLDEAVAAAP